MLLSELLFVLLLVAVLVVTCGVGLMVANMNRRSESQGAELAHLRTQMAMGGQAQDSAVLELRDRLGQAQTLLEGVRSAVVARHGVEEEARPGLRPLPAVVPRSPAP